MKNTKRIPALLLALLLLVQLLPTGTLAAFSASEIPEGFTGVYTVEDLYCIRYGLDGKYILMNDIDLTEATAEGGDWDNGHGWAPIGENGTIPFAGIFDGNGHTIRGMHITGIQTSYAGLFGYVTGEIRNLTVASANISTNGASYCGAVAGYVQNALENIIVSEASVTSKAQYTGGVTGYFKGARITNVKTDGTITAAYSGEKGYCGGIVGYSAASGAVIEKCVNNAKLTLSVSRSSSSSTISSSCYAYLGGITGYTVSGKTSESYNTGAVTATAYNSNTYYSSSTVSSNAYAYAGGINGSTGGKAENCYNTGTVTTSSSANASNTDYSTRTSTSSGSYSGGINGTGSADNCLNIGETVVTKGTARRGAISAGSGTLKNCYYKVGTAPSGLYNATDTATTAVALTAAQMKLKAVFGLLDFDGTWFVDNATGIDRPQLTNNPEAMATEPIILVSPANKLIYRQHEALDLTGMKISVNFQNQEAPVVKDVSPSMVTGYDPERIGQQELTLTCFGKTIRFSVTVTELPVEAVKFEKTKLTLERGDSEALSASVSPENATYQELSWLSDDESVAKVSANGTVTAVGCGYTVITAQTANGKKAVCEVNVLVPATAVKLNYTTAQLETGKTLQLTAALTPSDSTDTYSWSSSNPAAARVDENGLVTPVGKGTATITATTSRGVSASCTVSVIVRAEKVTLDQSEKTLTKGEMFLLNATVSPSDCSENVSWSSSDSSVASVSVVGRVTALNVGTAVITAVTESGKKAECQVTVVIPSTGITLSSSSRTISAGKTHKLSVTLTPSDTTDSVTWTSSDPTVAQVSNGVITGISPGTATITAKTDSGMTAACTVTVKQPATAVTLSQETVSVGLDKTLQLSAALTPANSTDSVKWLSSATDIVSVSSSGLVTAKAEGTAVVTATASSGVSASCTVTVVRIAAKSVKFPMTSVSIRDDEVLQLSPVISPADAYDTAESYVSADPSLVQVSADGKITCLGTGKTTVTVRTTNGLTAKITVNAAISPKSVTAETLKRTVDIGKTKKLTVTVAPENAEKKITWTSSDLSVAKVSSSGTVTGIALGTAEITAMTSNGLSVVFTVTVKHTFGSYTVIRNATCLTTGEEIRICKNCGAAETVTINATGHSYKSYKAKAATCTVSGYTAYKKCAACGETEGKETVKALGHSYTSKWTWTGTTKAVRTATCFRCGSKKTATALASKGQITSKTTKATCTASGKTVYTAKVTVDGKTYSKTKTVSIAKTAHKYGSPKWSWNSDKTSAKLTLTCSVCKKTTTGSGKITTKVTTRATSSKNGKVTYTAKATCNGKSYTSTKTATVYRLGTVKLSKTSIVCTGKTEKPTVTVKDSKGKTVSSENYTVKYSSSASKNPGTYKVTVTFRNKYSGTKTLSYTIKLAKATGLRRTYESGYVLALTWNSVPGATEYQIEYCGNDGKWKSSPVSTTKICMRMSPGKFYWRVRAVRKSGGKTYYGAYSDMLYVG